MAKEILQEVKDMRSLLRRMKIVENIGSIGEDDDRALEARAWELYNEDPNLDWELDNYEWDGGYATCNGFASIEDEDGTVYNFVSSGIYDEGNGYQVEDVEFDGID